MKNIPTIDMPLSFLKEVVAKREARKKARLERRKVGQRYYEGRIKNMEFEKFLDEHPDYILGQQWKAG